MSFSPLSISGHLRRSSLGYADPETPNPFASEEMKQSDADSKQLQSEKVSSPGGLLRTISGRIRRATTDRRSTVDADYLSRIRAASPKLKLMGSDRVKKIPESDATELGKLLLKGSLNAISIINILLRTEAGREELLTIARKLFFEENVGFLIAFDNFEKATELKKKSTLYQQLQAILDDKNGLNSNILAELSLGDPLKEKELRNSLKSSGQRELYNGIFLTAKVEAFRPIADKVKKDMILQLLPDLTFMYEAYILKPEVVVPPEVTAQ